MSKDYCAELSGDPSEGKITNIAVCIVVNGDGKVFLAKRCKPPFEGWWESAGGKIELGETAQQAALRELDEELGVRAKQLKKLKYLGFNEFILRRKYHRIGFFFAAKIATGTTIRLGEHEQGEWFDIRKLPSKVLPKFTGFLKMAVKEMKDGKKTTGKLPNKTRKARTRTKRETKS